MQLSTWNSITQLRLKLPDKLVKKIDRWISEGRFSSRRGAIETIVSLYYERERTRKFYETLVKRTDEARKCSSLPVPLKD